MSVVVSAFAHCRFVTEKVLGVPGNDVCLTGRNVSAARRATVMLLSTMCWDLPHEPFRAAKELLTRTAVSQPRDIAGRRLRCPLVLSRASPACHSAPYQPRQPPGMNPKLYAASQLP